jgi:hypothetical protein
MAVVYYKIGQALAKQNKYMKSVCSITVRRSAPGSSFNFLKFIRNRRTFLVCLITVLCFGTANIPISAVWYILYIAGENNFKKYVWIIYLANVLRAAGSGQKIAHILETLPQEGTETTRKLIRQFL